jgi:hypothetical protein
MSKACTAALLLTLLALPACDRGNEAPRVEVDDAWVRLPAVKGRPGAAYFRLEANSRPMHLVSVSSPQVRRIELHESGGEGSKAKMTKLENPFFERNTMEFRPDGRHAMLFDIAKGVKPGDKITLTFTFDPAPPVTIEAVAKAAGEAHEDGH